MPQFYITTVHNGERQKKRRERKRNTKENRERMDDRRKGEEQKSNTKVLSEQEVVTRAVKTQFCYLPKPHALKD